MILNALFAAQKTKFVTMMVTATKKVLNTPKAVKIVAKNLNFLLQFYFAMKFFAEKTRHTNSNTTAIIGIFVKIVTMWKVVVTKGDRQSE